MATETDEMQAEQLEQMTKEERIIEVNLLIRRLHDTEKWYGQAVATTDKFQTLAARLRRLSLFGDQPGLPRQVYRIAYSDAIDTNVMLYAGRLDFTVKSVIGADGRIRKLKPEHMKEFHIEVGLDVPSKRLKALNSAELPPHPNIGDYICLGDLDISEFYETSRLTESAMEAVWTKSKESIISVLSTANIMGGFHSSYVTEVYEQPGIYEDDGKDASADMSPVWSSCHICYKPENICIECGLCTDEHCMGVVCEACGELFHDGICGDCSRCDDCGHADDCERVIDDEPMCSECGTRGPLYECGLCADCHINSGHGTCQSCGSHMDEGEYMGDCGDCQDCCNGAGHTFCIDCSSHLYLDDIMRCTGCNGPICRDCLNENGSRQNGLQLCAACIETNPQPANPPPGEHQQHSMDSVWHS